MYRFPLLLAIVALGLSACSTNIIPGSTGSLQKSSAQSDQTGWDSSYGGVDKTYDGELLKMRARIAPRFQTLTFDDKITGKTMAYNLYIPADYDQSQKYPLVLFIADGSTVGRGVEAPLMQGYGGIIWATNESQAKNPCFVLVPSYSGPEKVVDDTWQTSDEVEITLRLLDSIIGQYSIDTDRLYATGQSMGGMMSFYFNATHPDIFAASIFVASQWDTRALAPLANNTFFYIVSAADPKASKGMRELGNMLQEKGVPYGSTSFSAKLSELEQKMEINNLIDQGFNINFVQFTAGTVTPEGAQGPGSEHMYSFDYAYKLKAVRDWLFQQTKKASVR